MLKIHGVPISVHTRKVIVSALEKRLPFDNEPVIPFRPPADWHSLSPTGKIPVLSDGAFSIADSSVICAYLERLHPQAPLYPPETRDYVMALWFEEYADGTLFREVMHPLFYQLYIRPKILGQPTDRAVVATTCQDALPRVFGYLEGALAGDYFAGKARSIADTAVASNLINYHYLGFTLDPARWPRLASFFARLTQTDSMRTALLAERATAQSMGLDCGFLEHVQDR